MVSIYFCHVCVQSFHPQPDGILLSPWAGAPASHLSRLHAVETKAFQIIGISRDEADTLGPSLSHRRKVGATSYHQLTDKNGPLILFIGGPSGRSLNQTSAKSTLPIGASLHVTNRPSCDHSWPMMPCLWYWMNGRKQPFARITERKREALIKQQQQPSTELPNVDGKRWVS